jgi:hypothetical protein
MEKLMSQINTGSVTAGSRLIPAVTVDETTSHSAVSWAAILAGAAGAAALSLLLVILGSGLGFSAVSPWQMDGISATTFGVAAIVWLSFTQLAASGVGGYLAGRLRTKWTDVHTDEVYFRDTAHGFLTWAISSLLTAVVLTSILSSIGIGIRAGAEVVSEATASAAGTMAGSAVSMASTQAGAGEQSNALSYFVDSLFREGAEVSDEAASPTPQPQSLSDDTTEAVNDAATPMLAGREAVPVNAALPLPQPQPAPAMNNSKSASSVIPVPEVTRILARALYDGSLPQEDKSYVAQLISQHTELSQQQAEQRLSQGFMKVQTMLKNAETTAKETADEARKASAYTALWMSVALLLGAFVASLMAVFGGRQRDA